MNLVSVHVVDFFNRINLIYGTVCEQCTDASCPTMSGGPKFEYLWQDGSKYKKPTPLPANQYISFLMDWIESQVYFHPAKKKAKARPAPAAINKKDPAGANPIKLFTT